MDFKRILVLAKPEMSNSHFIEGTRRQCDVVVIETMEQAISQLRSGRFDAVISQAGDFLAMERMTASLQTSLILNTIGEGVCLVDAAGRVAWTNNRMKTWSAEVSGRIFETCRNAITFFNKPTDANAKTPEKASPKSRKFALNIDDTRFFEIVCSPVLEDNGRVAHVVAVCWDASHNRLLQQKLDAIDQAGRELVRLENESIARMDMLGRLRLLEEKIIKFCRQLMHFDHFNIRLLERSTNKLEPVISVGMPAEASDVELFCSAEGNGICGYVAATGRSYIAYDAQKDPRYVAGLDTARSSLTVPLTLQDKVIGVFNIESDSPAFFSEDDRQFAEIFARYVAIALNILDLLAEERRTTSGRLVEDVACEMAGPINDIDTLASRLLDLGERPDTERQMLESIVIQAEKLRETLRGAGRGGPVLRGPKSVPTDTDVSWLKNKRILIADDQANTRDTLRGVLVCCGCQVDIAIDGEEAIALLASQPRFDLVISDIRMPRKNGYEVFSAAQKLGHKPPVILMTAFGWDPEHQIVRATQEGLAAVLSKRFDVPQLLREIRKAMNQPVPGK